MTKLKGRQKAKARKAKQAKSSVAKTSYTKRMVSKIHKYDNEVLTQKCEEVAQGTDVSKTITTMKKVLGCTENGVGLAASQIGILDRIIVVRTDAKKYDIKAMINPEIISHSEKAKYGIEMCLSYPRATGFIERFTWIEVSYYDEEWNKRVVKYKEGDISGIIIQHEISHLNGLCEIHSWWKNPEGMRSELQEIFDKKGKPIEELTSSYEMVESEDLKREKEEIVASE